MNTCRDTVLIFTPWQTPISKATSSAFKLYILSVCAVQTHDLGADNVILRQLSNGNIQFTPIYTNEINVQKCLCFATITSKKLHKRWVFSKMTTAGKKAKLLLFLRIQREGLGTSKHIPIWDVYTHISNWGEY